MTHPYYAGHGLHRGMHLNHPLYAGFHGGYGGFGGHPWGGAYGSLHGGYGGYGGHPWAGAYGGLYGGYGAFGGLYGGYGGYGGHGRYGHPGMHLGMYGRHMRHPLIHANYGYDYNYYPNPDLIPKDEEDFRKNMPKYEIPLIYSPGRHSPGRAGSPNRGSPRSTNSPSPGRKAIIDRQRLITQEMNAMKHPRVSCAVDFIDPIYKHLDPISVSLQERVKFGGHITSITRSTQLANPNGDFFFHTS